MIDPTIIDEVKRRTKQQRLEMPEDEKPRTNDFLEGFGLRGHREADQHRRVHLIPARRSFQR